MIRLDNYLSQKTSPVIDRINALKELHNHGIKTYAMIAPILPGAERIMELLEGKVDYIYVDRMNYQYANIVYKKNKLDDYLDSDYFYTVERKIARECRKINIKCNIVY